MQSTEDFIDWCRAQKLFAEESLAMIKRQTIPIWKGGVDPTEEIVANLEKMVSEMQNMIDAYESGELE